MTPERAATLARKLYDGRYDRHGLPEIEHPTAVAARLIAPDAIVVAYLHDTIEDGLISLPELRAHGITDTQASALHTITRKPSETYTQYIDRVATAPGAAGTIARNVKIADLHTNLDRPGIPGAEGLSARYHRALKRLNY